MKHNSIRPLAAILGASVLASTLAAAANAGNPFQLTELQSGYQLAGDETGSTDAKPAEGKCGEGKCGEGKKAHAEGKCGEGKKEGAEGKCGEGKCGEKKAEETKPGTV
jgi:uncharacterized low-complexity protein